MKKKSSKAARGGNRKAQTEKGFEKVGGRQIPYVRNLNPDDYVVTTYGSQDGADHARKRVEKIGGRKATIHGSMLLVKHERRGSVSWGVVANGRSLIPGKVSNKLQGIIDTREGDWLFHTVQHIRQFPEAISDLSTNGAGRIIHDALLKDILGGRTFYTPMIAKIIEAVELMQKEEAIAERIMTALIDVAIRLGKIPLKKEVLEEFEKSQKDATDADNFLKELRRCGLSWLPTRR